MAKIPDIKQTEFFDGDIVNGDILYKRDSESLNYTPVAIVVRNRFGQNSLATNGVVYDIPEETKTFWQRLVYLFTGK